jgi:hypothetical protein
MSMIYRPEEAEAEAIEAETCCLPYCEDAVWVRLVVRGERQPTRTVQGDIDSGLTTLDYIRPDDIVGDLYIRSRVMGFCEHHATTTLGESLYDSWTDTEGPAEEGMVVGRGRGCDICGAANTPCVSFYGGSRLVDGRDGGKCCAVCADEEGVC